MTEAYKILFLDDNAADVTLLQTELDLAGIKYMPHRVSDEKGFLAAIKDFNPHIVLADHALKAYNGIEAFNFLKQNKFRPAFIIITADLKEQLAFDCCSEGVDDFIFKTNIKALPSSFLKAMEKRRTEVQRDKMAIHILKRNKELEQFAYAISHNLRGSVANIQGLFNIWDPEKRTKHEQKYIHEGIKHSIQKLDEVIKDMNYVLQVKEEAHESKQLVKFEKLVKDIKMSIYMLVREKNAKIKFDFAEVESIVSNRSYIHSIFYNLIMNSIKYKKENESPKILITSRFTDEHIELRFKDNGIGIDLEKYGDKIFGLYKRFNETLDGKGMGLFLVKSQVESMMGTIEVKSRIREGTEFIIKLPLLN
jgi:signal transduction histidine kinase